MKKLYALLVILIILYIGINVGTNNLPFGDSTALNTTDNATAGISMGNINFPKIDNFTDNKINDTAVSYRDANYNMTINVSTVDNGQSVADIASGLLSSGRYTSNQTIDQNGVTTYFLYNEGSESYSADIYFSKDNQNFLISGEGISYENSDYFINHCKNVIDAIGSK